MSDSTLPLVLGLVSISDRASQGVYADEGLPSLRAWCEKAIVTPLVIHERLIPDDQKTIEATLKALADETGCHLILTTGGTGPSRRDVTPEATLAVGTREMPGFGEKMRQISGHFVPTAILSRQVAVLRETPTHASLIVNLPGRPKAIQETLEGLKAKDGTPLVDGLFAAIPYCLELMNGPIVETDPNVVKAFRPKSKATHQPVRQAPPAFEPADIHRVTPQGTKKPELYVVFLHGLGADNHDFAPFVQEIAAAGGPVCEFIMPNAPMRHISIEPGYPMRGWYDIRSMHLNTQEDQEGLLASSQRIATFIDQLEAAGIPRKKLLLGGFSQGAAITLLTGLRLSRPIAGLIALSGYTPIEATLYHGITDAGTSMPLFMAHGDFDEIISPMIAQEDAETLEGTVENFTFHTYPMGHQVCTEEIVDLASFLRTLAK